ncbi:MAG: SufE family protein, partial [Verrucomicrobiota bacterium]
MTIAEKQNQLLDELALFNDWTERYEYVIGLGKKLPAMEESAKTA